MEKSKQDDMMTDNNMSSWYALHTAPKSERKLMRRLNAAGYTVFCPTQIVFKRWNGQTKEMFVPLFPGCLFVEEAVDVTSFIDSQDATLIVDNKGKSLSIYTDKAGLPSKFAQILK